MKSPRQQKLISDYFVGVFPEDELRQMVDECVAQVLESDDDLDWQVLFENKILVKQIQLEMKLKEAYEQV